MPAVPGAPFLKQHSKNKNIIRCGAWNACCEDFGCFFDIASFSSSLMLVDEIFIPVLRPPSLSLSLALSLSLSRWLQSPSLPLPLLMYTHTHTHTHSLSLSLSLSTKFPFLLANFANKFSCLATCPVHRSLFLVQDLKVAFKQFWLFLPFLKISIRHRISFSIKIQQNCCWSPKQTKTIMYFSSF